MSRTTRGLRRYRLARVIAGVVCIVAVVAAADSVSGAPSPHRSGSGARSEHVGATEAAFAIAPLGPRESASLGGVAISTHLIVASAGDPATGGYWLTASDGGIFAFGAPFEGSTGALQLVKPIVGMTPTASGAGYWLVASDGGIFAFGNAAFRGSMGASPLNRPIVGMAATPDGAGYWLVASDGGIFAFGDAAFLGSAGAITLHSPVVGMQAAGGGYRLVAADGGLFSYDTPFYGSAVGTLARRAVSLDSSGTGYRIVSTDGAVHAYGGAEFLGSVQVLVLADQVVTIDPGHNGGNASHPGFVNTSIDGGGIVQACDTTGTATADGYDEHAFNYDVAGRLVGLLEAAGARVVLTRTADNGVGPCVNTRAAIGNAAGSDAVISIHGDGGPSSGRGFAVDVPVPVVSAISDNRAIVDASGVLGADIRDGFLATTGEPTSDYSGSGGITPRSDLGGLNLSTVPKVLVECGNMANPTDAAAMEDPNWRQRAAQGLLQGITAFLIGRMIP